MRLLKSWKLGLGATSGNSQDCGNREQEDLKQLARDDLEIMETRETKLKVLGAHSRPVERADDENE